MTRSLRILIALAAPVSLGFGCGSRATEVPAAPSAPPTPPPRRVLSPSLYDADGVPRASDRRVAGLTLPVDLSESRRVGRRHIYHSTRIPAARMLRYFGPRLVTVLVEREGARVTYRDALPRGVRGGAVKLDVTIEPTSSAPARVEIRERPPPAPPGVTVSADEIRRHLTERARHRE